MTFIICEIGSNWSDLEDCLISIVAAKNAGADAVKFQLYTWLEMYGEYPPMTEKAMLPGELPPEWLPTLKAKADEVGIEFMCTAFSPQGVRLVDPHVKRHKIASSDITALDILQTAAATKKPIILSCGAASQYQINMAMMHIHMVRNDLDLTLLYCVSSYPANKVDLRKIDALRDHWQVPVGYSDHTVDDTYIPWAAVHNHGATVIEKHVNFVGAAGPDSPHSLSGHEFKHMVQMIREPSQPHIGPTAEEADMIKWHQRRLIEVDGKLGYYRIRPNA